MRTIDRDGFGPAVRDDSENLKLYLARRVQQRTAKFRCRCYRRAGTWSSFDRGKKIAATAATVATATTDLDAKRAREKSDGSFGAEEILEILEISNYLMIFRKYDDFQNWCLFL